MWNIQQKLSFDAFIKICYSIQYSQSHACIHCQTSVNLLSANQGSAANPKLKLVIFWWGVSSVMKSYDIGGSWGATKKNPLEAEGSSRP
jgi:hypothetical protein